MVTMYCGPRSCSTPAGSCSVCGMAIGSRDSLASEDDDIDKEMLAPMTMLATKSSLRPLNQLSRVWCMWRRQAVVGKRCCVG
jgi:hypothetical protein